MDLYKVTLTYEDLVGKKDWNKRFEEHMRTHVGCMEFSEPLPARKRVSTYVAVFPGWAGDPLTRAGNLAAERCVAPRTKWDEWMPCIESIEAVGSVAVEKPEE